ncbi:MAG: VIT1/CCC1 family protein, partial [Candidatus Hodarchaeota archaeon]
MGNFDEKTKKALLKAQKDEINSYHIYKRLAYTIKSSNNAEILNSIAEEEKKHYNVLKGISGNEVKPNKLKLYFYIFLLKFFGLTFGIRLMEQGEYNAQSIYSDVAKFSPEIGMILEDEEKHEKQLIELLDEELLEYIGSIVLGLSDALVELTGALAGFTLALQNAQLIAIIGFITGVSAALSMGASEYLSTSEEKNTSKSPFKAAL